MPAVVVTGARQKRTSWLPGTSIGSPIGTTPVTALADRRCDPSCHRPQRIIPRNSAMATGSVRPPLSWRLSCRWPPKYSSSLDLNSTCRPWSRVTTLAHDRQRPAPQARPLRLLQRAAAGEEIVIAAAGRPKTKLVGLRETTPLPFRVNRLCYVADPRGGSRQASGPRQAGRPRLITRRREAGRCGRGDATPEPGADHRRSRERAAHHPRGPSLTVPLRSLDAIHLRLGGAVPMLAAVFDDVRNLTATARLGLPLSPLPS